MLERLREALSGHPAVVAVRGLGLMIGIELHKPIPDLVALTARNHGLLINVTRGKTIRLLPPLIVGPADVDAIVQGIVNALNGAEGLGNKCLRTAAARPTRHRAKSETP